MSSVEPMSQITIKVETVEDEDHKEAFNNNGLKNQSSRKQVQSEFAKSSAMTLIEVDPESKIIELKAEDILGNDDDFDDGNNVGTLEDEKDVESDEEEFDFEDIDDEEEEDSDMSWLGTTPDSEESLEDDLDRDVIEEDLDVEERDADDPDSKDTDEEDQDEKEKDNNESKRKKKKKSSFDFNGVEIVSKGNYSKCPRCQKNIKSTFILRHIKLHDLPIEKFPCPEKDCPLVVSRINNLFRHLKVVHKCKKPYFCKHEGCKEKFSKPQMLRDHFATHRAERRQLRAAKQVTEVDVDGSKTYACEFPGCGKEYGKRHHLREHERKHTGDMRFSCDVCGKKFYIQAHMKRHLYSHTGIKPHVCRWKCGAIFASYGGRMKHERINHYEENPLQSDCDICGRPFKNQQQLAKHRMTHLNPSERLDYRCSFCGIMLDTIKLRERHEERHRDGETFTCETCHRSFKNEKNLTHHIKKHHTEEAKEEKKSTSTSKGKESAKKEESNNLKHPCHLCGPPKLFCLTSLRRHLARIHSQNFKCDRAECGKGFKEKVQFDAHMEIHRMRECHLCGKKFQRKQNADIHLMGVHKLTTSDLESLGRWKSKSKDPTHCPEYMVRTARNKKRKKKSEKKTVDVLDVQELDDMLEIKTEIISDGEEDEDDDNDEESHPDSLPDPVSRPPVPSNISYIIAHGPNGLISIPRR